MFSYNPLDKEKREIRLIRFTPSIGSADSAAGPISLEIQHFSLKDDVAYASLSYTWGTDRDTEEIKINHVPFHVTRNLHAALEQLQKNRLDSWLWIDAICIDMSNKPERGHQVGEMREIYSRASVVHVWLGQGDLASDSAMDFVSRLGPAAIACGVTKINNEPISAEVISYVKDRLASQACGESTSDISGPALGVFLYDLFSEDDLYSDSPLQDGINDILRRDYWHRIWSFQELALSKEAIVHVGTRSVSLEMFDAIFSSMWKRGFELKKLLPRWNEFTFCYGGTLYKIVGLDIWRKRHCNSETAIKLTDILWIHVVSPERPFYSATDPRDFLYGLLGMISKEQAERVCVDYGKSVEEVFTETTRVAFDESAGSDYPMWDFRLDFCVPGETSGSLPTWVPDWREIGKYGVRPWRINHNKAFRAAGEVLRQAGMRNSEMEDSRALCQSGCRVDIITEVMQPPVWIRPGPHHASQIRDADAWFRSIARFVGLGLSGPGEDYVWRTLLRDTRQRNKHNQYEGISMIGGLHALCRKMMRLEDIDSSSLTKEEADFVHNGPPAMNSDLAPTDLNDAQVASFAKMWRYRVGSANRNRTLFKTSKGMLGLGHVVVEPGDIVTLIWDVCSPIVLRHRADGGFYFRGDAYVDGIMNGEFLATDPKHEEFSLY